MPLTPLTGALGKTRAAHLLRRTCTGATPTEIDEFAVLSASEAFARLALEDLPKPLPPIDPATGATWIDTIIVEDVNSDDLGNLLNAWFVGQLLGTDATSEQKLAHTFRERLVLFMHTLFTTKSSKTSNTKSLYHQMALFRHFAIDTNDIEVPTPNPDPESEEVLPPTIYPVNFKHLTKKVCVENAMLQFLDGRQNVKGNPNENFARELFELYTIGRGLEGSVPDAEFQGDYIYYTEEDVQAAARVLSGFDVNDENEASGFTNIDEETEIPRGVIRGGNIATQHDTGIKTFSSRLGGATIQADPDLLAENNNQLTEEVVLDEISQLVDLIYEQDQTSLHICRRLYRFFVYHQVDETIQAGVIQDMADIFQANDFKIIPVLEALFTSEEFYRGGASVEDDAFGGIIKSPLDITVGFMKTFGITIPSAQTEVDNFYSLTRGILSQLGLQGMDLYDPYEVAGYSAYHQFPLYNRSWITTNYLMNRYNFIRNSFSTADLDLDQVNPIDWIQANIPDSTASDARALIISLAEYLLPMSNNLSFDGAADSEITQERMNYFLDAFLMNPQIDADPEAAWTERWNGGLDMDTVNNQLANLLNAMLQTPEYQLM